MKQALTKIWNFFEAYGRVRAERTIKYGWYWSIQNQTNSLCHCGHDCLFGNSTMSEYDQVEAVVKHMHIVLPIVGAVLIFMLAAIAITMA